MRMVTSPAGDTSPHRYIVTPGSRAGHWPVILPCDTAACARKQRAGSPWGPSPQQTGPAYMPSTAVTLVAPEPAPGGPDVVATAGPGCAPPVPWATGEPGGNGCGTATVERLPSVGAGLLEPD